nr:pentatricopeptide repeat-containing protein, chloroplastic [Quercus suber]
MELEPCDAGVYVSLSNICADMGEWEDVLKIRSLMKGTGVTKEPVKRATQITQANGNFSDSEHILNVDIYHVPLMKHCKD